MTTYTAKSIVTGEAIYEPATDEMIEAISIGVRVFKDGVAIGEFELRYSAAADNEQIRQEVLGNIRSVVEQEIIGSTQMALDQRAGAIQAAIDTWEKVI